MASPAAKTHYLRRGYSDLVACGRRVETVQHVDGNVPIAHPSGRLMSRHERASYVQRTVTCQLCLRRRALREYERPNA